MQTTPTAPDGASAPDMFPSAASRAGPSGSPSTRGRWLVHPTLAIALTLAGITTPARAQGITDYTNFEAPQLKPLALATFQHGSAPDPNAYLLVANTPDDAIEVYRTSDNAFVARVPVGLEPVTVAVKPSPTAAGDRRCYSANWLGDSISVFDLHADGTATIVMTENLGDEPMGIAFGPGDESLVVTFSAPALWGWFDPNSLAPMRPGSGTRELIDSRGKKALKDPRAVAFAPQGAIRPGALFVLNFRGGNDALDLDGYDYDVFGLLNFAAPSEPCQSDLVDVFGIGSTNFNMAFASNGDLFVVSQNARNKVQAFVNAIGEPLLRELVTNGSGFVTSQLVRIQRAGEAVSPTTILDLNAPIGGVHPSIPIAQPTDVVIQGSGGDGVTKVFVTGFASDSLGVIQPVATGPWPITRVDLRTNTPFSDTNTAGTVRGPRAMILKETGLPNDPARLYVLNRIENSITIIDPDQLPSNPTGAILGTFALQHDPTPRYVKESRKFLYSARLSSHETVSCASCHVDGNSDFLAWNLADGKTIPTTNQPPAGLPPGILAPQPTPTKGPMVTQPLRGLVNFEVQNDVVQDRYFSNKPYHWRGDRADFDDFNGAFIHLMDIANPYSAQAGQGISPASMDAFRRLVNSIHYPPNPEEPAERVYSGAMVADPAHPGADHDDPFAGHGAQRGLKQFHISPSLADLSCVHCHSLPDGSNNRLTESLPYAVRGALPSSGVLDVQNIEVAQLKGALQKEKILWRTDAIGAVTRIVVPGSVGIATAEFGLIHTGKRTTAGTTPADSLDSFLHAAAFDPSTFTHNDVNRYLREFDSGVAPQVGRVKTVHEGLMSSAASVAAVNTVVGRFERQANLANAGLAVHARLNGVLHGFSYDVTSPTRPYVEVPHGAVAIIPPQTRAELLRYVTPGTGTYTAGNLLVFQSTTLGSARRVANLDGGDTPPVTVSAPSAIVLCGAVPSTHNALVPRMSANLYSRYSAATNNFFTGNITRNLGNNITLLLFEAALKDWASAPAQAVDLGLNAYRHEAPRRFVVQGNGIREGAWLRIYLPTAADQATATRTTPPSGTFVASAHPDPLYFPIFPCDEDPNDTISLVWQTAVEIEPLFLLELVCGSRSVQNVQNALDDPQKAIFTNEVTPPSGPAGTNLFDPLRNNWYFVEVVNDPLHPGSTTGSGGWQRLKLE